MKWDGVVQELSAVVRADAQLVALFGSQMRFAGSGAHQTPLLEWSLIGDGEDELWDKITVQFDCWVRSQAALGAAERRLRQLFHQELPAPVGLLRMWCQYQDGEVLAFPDRDGYFGRALRFRFTPLRERYEPSPTSPGS